jgi:ComF family protein
MIDRFWQLLLGSYCVLCRAVVKGAEGDRQLCRWCLASLPWLSAPEPDTPPQGIARAFAPLGYEGAARQWVLDAKHERGLVSARTLGVLLAESLLDAYPLPSERPGILLPVPLSRRRLRTRGHNQALLIGQPVARRLNLRLDRHSARRTRHTALLAGLDPVRRHAEVAAGFSVSALPEGSRVAIIDDVVTTGATASALADAILLAGASEVHLWAATRAPHSA